MLYELKYVKNTPTLVFLHGFLGNALDWTDVVSYLPLSCIAIDLPGHGKAPFTPDFTQAIVACAPSPFHLIGYSMGGRLALQFANRYPEKIASLTLLGAHLGLKTGHQERLAHDRNMAKKLLSIPIDEFLRIWYDQPIFKTLLSKVDIHSMRKEQNKEHLALALTHFSLGHQSDLSHISARRLVGEFDVQYRAHYQDFPHIVIPNAGHAAHLENPQAVAGAIYDAFS